MYPRDYFSLFPPFGDPGSNTVFVAMDFSDQFQRRWKDVIEPGIASVAIGGAPLKPLRIDQGQVSNSVLTEILDGIRSSLLVFADITSVEDDSKSKPIRNANVLYEVGLAQALRPPEEVLLFRSDKKPLLFDLSSIRVNPYDPDGNPGKAKEELAKVLMDALRERDSKRSIAVTRAVASLDERSWMMLLMISAGATAIRPVRTMRDAIGEPPRRLTTLHLLQLNLIEAQFPNLKAIAMAVESGKGESTMDEFVRYTLTPLGQAVVGELMKRLSEGHSPEDMKAFLSKYGGGLQE